MTEFFMGRLKHGRPELSIAVGLCDLEHEARALKGKPAQPIEARAIIDTTRFVTTINADVLRAVGIEPSIAGGGLEDDDQVRGHCVSLALRSLTGAVLVMKRLHVLAAEPDSQEFPVMLGIDALRRHTLTLTVSRDEVRLVRG